MCIENGQQQVEERVERLGKKLYYTGATAGPATLSADVAWKQPQAVEAIRARAASLRAEADRLDRLASALPGELSPEANEALWGLVTRAGSR